MYQFPDSELCTVGMKTFGNTLEDLKYILFENKSKI